MTSSWGVDGRAVRSLDGLARLLGPTPEGGTGVGAGAGAELELELELELLRGSAPLRIRLRRP